MRSQTDSRGAILPISPRDPNARKHTPSEIQAHEFAQAIGYLVGDRTARASYFFDYVAPGQCRARDPHLTLPVRDVKGNRVDPGAHMGMLVPLEYLRTQEGRELQSFAWYLAVRRENGSQGVRTPLGPLFRVELKGGAEVLAYLRERLRLQDGDRAKPAEHVARATLGGKKVHTLKKPARGVVQSPEARLAAASDMVWVLQRVRERIPQSDWLRDALTEAVRMVLEEPNLGLEDIARELWPDASKRKEALRAIRKHAKPILRKMTAG